MEQSGNVTIGDSGLKNFKPMLAKRQYKHYKPVAIFYRRLLIGSALLLMVLLYALVMALRGNHTLKAQLNGTETIVIEPTDR